MGADDVVDLVVGRGRCKGKVEGEKYVQMLGRCFTVNISEKIT